jgi:hypothetical protein
MTNRPLPL